MTNNVFSDALQILRERGWTQGEMEDRAGVCAVGAINCALTGNACGESDFNVCLDPLAILAREVDDDGIAGTYSDNPEYLHELLIDTIAKWNDDPKRRKDDVFAVFEKLAKKSESAGFPPKETSCKIES